METQPDSLPPPRGIDVKTAAALLQVSPITVRRMIASYALVAWKPRGPRGRKWLVDEVSLGAVQAAMIRAARRRAAPVQAELIQGTLPLA